MIIEQIYTGCLAQGAYYIESNGEAAVIDPLREVQAYIGRATKNGAKIKYIFETHFHADFVSGHVTLAKKTGATIVFGPNAATDFDALVAMDNQEFRLGNVCIKALHTPGHTMESTTYLLIDEEGKDHAIFSGDTLFLGDVGRPDLAQKAADMTQEELAGLLYDSLRNKIMPLADNVIVYPAHGAGSACGKKLSNDTIGSIGEQKRTNYALRADMTKEEFTKEVLDGLLPPPAYFPMNVKLNKEGYDDVEEVIQRGALALSPEAFEAAANETDAVLLDVRHQRDFAAAHIPGSIFIGIDGGFAPWVGALIRDIKQSILLVVPEGREEEVITRLARVGFDTTIGYLEGGMEKWTATGKKTDRVISISVAEFKSIIDTKDVPVFDVRKQSEYEQGQLVNSQLTPLDRINDHLSEYPKDETFFLHCAGGYRSMIAASILKSRGIHDLVDIQGGFNAIQSSGIKTVKSQDVEVTK